MGIGKWMADMFLEFLVIWLWCYVLPLESYFHEISIVPLPCRWIGDVHGLFFHAFKSSFLSLGLAWISDLRFVASGVFAGWCIAVLHVQRFLHDPCLAVAWPCLNFRHFQGRFCFPVFESHFIKYKDLFLVFLEVRIMEGLVLLSCVLNFKFVCSENRIYF